MRYRGKITLPLDLVNELAEKYGCKPDLIHMMYRNLMACIKRQMVFNVKYLLPKGEKPKDLIIPHICNIYVNVKFQKFTQNAKKKRIQKNRTNV